ncbi:MAG: hypothetical protein FK733_19100 [Asgard group archaeon]|nr:hypothetical protein [Asgard group archaeon]
MRLFKIKDQPKKYLFDLDGNVFHPKLRDEIKPGMVVGLRLTDREIPKISEEKRIDDINKYNRLFKQYMSIKKKRKEHHEEIKIEIQKIIEKLTIENDNFLAQQKSVKEKLNKLIESKHDEPFIVEDFEVYVQKTQVLGFILSELNKKQTDLQKQIKKLKYQLNLYSIDSNYLITNFNFPPVLFKVYNACEELHDELQDIMYQYRRDEEKPWKETIFFKVVKRTKDKLHGDVIENYRRPDSKCPLKLNDRISFYDKSILFVPSNLNQKAKLQTHYLTDYKYQYYRTDKVNDWSGVFLDKKARDHLTPGSIVRIQMKEITKNRKEIWYAYILKKEGELFTGELLDFYKLEREYYNDEFKIGCIHKFKKESITEIPIMWNEHLPILKKFLNKDNWGYVVTGYRGDENYFDL